jgi:hypothetical protein
MIIPKKEILYAPMLGTLGGGSAKGYGFSGGGGPKVGEHVFYGGSSFSNNANTSYTFVVPAGVQFISVLSVGGGGSAQDQHDGCGAAGGALAYKNNIAVSAGQSVDVRAGCGGDISQTNTRTNTVGTDGGASYISIAGTTYALAYGGRGGNNGYAAGYPVAAAGYSAADGGGNGGRLVRVSGTRTGGSGAGGYAGSGGDAGGYFYNTSYRASNGTGGGGGGGEGANGGNAYYCAGGGGVGIYGQGANGVASPINNPASGQVNAALGGSGAGYSGVGAGNHSGAAPNGFGDFNRDFGGGGGGAHNGDFGGKGGQGVVRIIWGEGRSFPSTNVDEASSEGNVFLN